LSDPSIAARQAAQPGRKVTAERRLIGDRRAVVFDDGFDPLAFLLVEAVEPFDLDAFLLLRVRREHVANIQSISHPTAVLNLGHRIASQGRRISHVGLLELHQPHEGDQGVGDGFLDGIRAGFGIEVAEYQPRVRLDRRKHGEESLVPGRHGPSSWGSETNHRTVSFRTGTAPAGRSC